MPKKFKGENSKAAVAKERKQAAKQEADERKRRAEEDAYWKDDDKHAQRKQDRRVLRKMIHLYPFGSFMHDVALWAAASYTHFCYHRLNVIRSDRNNWTRSRRPNSS